MEQLFNPAELYNYLRNHHWKEGIPESFIKEWSEMGLSQYHLTENDRIDFEFILKELSISPVEIKDNKKSKIKVKRVKKVSSSIEKNLGTGKIPSVTDFQRFKAWVFGLLDEIENSLEIQSAPLNSNVKNVVRDSTTNDTKDLKTVIVDLTNILMKDLDSFS